jgi:hypothetical protein
VTAYRSWDSERQVWVQRCDEHGVSMRDVDEGDASQTAACFIKRGDDLLTPEE